MRSHITLYAFKSRHSKFTRRAKLEIQKYRNILALIYWWKQGPYLIIIIIISYLIPVSVTDKDTVIFQSCPL
jgi:hypothetical protein